MAELLLPPSVLSTLSSSKYDNVRQLAVLNSKTSQLHAFSDAQRSALLLLDHAPSLFSSAIGQLALSLVLGARLSEPQFSKRLKRSAKTAHSGTRRIGR